MPARQAITVMTPHLSAAPAANETSWADQAVVDVTARGGKLAVKVAADPVFLVDLQRIDAGIQAALGLREMQADGRRLASVGEQLSEVIHVGPRLVFRRKLLQRDKSGCQRFGDNPLIVARNSLSGHWRTPHRLAPRSLL